MRKNLLLILFSISLGIYANDSIVFPTDTNILINEYDLRLLDYSLSWLDTTECTAEVDTFSLSDSLCMARLASLPHVIEMPYNPLIRRFILRYVKYSPRQVASMQRKALQYFPIFEDALMRHNLPMELKYLAVVESGLKATAISPMGAAGLWQFMPYTAKLNGLEVNSLVDERMDPIKSTEAACKFLKHLYGVYGDWNLAIAAYNCGPGNVNKAIHRSGGKKDFWSIYYFLPQETRAYLPLFIAANYAMNFANEHNICPDTKTPLPIAADTVWVNKRIHLQQVAEVMNVPLKDLRLLNPQYRWDVLPGGKDYALCLPLEQTGAYIHLQDSIASHKADSLLVKRREFIDMAKLAPAGEFGSGGVIKYKIKSGDTLGGIAKKYKVTVKQLQRWNGIKGSNIRAGKTLKIYK